MTPVTGKTLAGLNVPVPGYDRRQVITGIVHIGVGGFHRSHQAMYIDTLMNRGAAMDWGICGIGVQPSNTAMRDALAAQDGLYTLVLRHGDGTWEPRVIGSIVEYLFAPDDPEAAIEKMAEPAIRITGHVRFPNGMVDRITPQTTDEDRAELSRRFGLDDRWPVFCEPFTQWVLEDDFADGRPPLEDAGVRIVSDVEPYELMKLRLLNASHQALCYPGYLAGYRLVHEVTTDPLFARFLLDYMTAEAIPTLKPVPGLDIHQYARQLIERFSNPEVRDTVARLCANTSDLIPKFLLPVIRHQLAASAPFTRSAAVVASWARY